MSKKTFKSQASSSRAVSNTFGGAFDDASLGAPQSNFGGVNASPLSHVYEPPDLRALADPNVVVAFKNVQKKDSITKSRALEDLQGYILSSSNHDGLQEAFLEAWINIYPRTSIDNSRRVRQLAHTLQGQIAASSGKRIAKHMPSIIGTWLAGIYDNDKSVSRAAQESFKVVFPSEEKYKGVWRIYQVDIVQLGEDVIMKESPNTLSDERTTSPDDANAKYHRTLAAVLMMITNLIETSDITELTKSESQIRGLLESDQLWKFASSPDAFVRRSIYRLLLVSLDKQRSHLNPGILSSTMLTSALHTPQLGSSYDYIRAITQMSITLPSVWTGDYTGTGKKAAKSCLCHFLRKGSQGAQSDFWTYVGRLMGSLPHTMMVGEVQSSSQSKTQAELPSFEVLGALHDGIINKDEPRSSSNSAWLVYLSTVELISDSLTTDGKAPFLEKHVVPLVIQYVRPSLDHSQWSIRGLEARDVCEKACMQILSEAEPVFLSTWQDLSSKLIEDLKVSLPEQSKDYIKSQDSISTQMTRYYSLQSQLDCQISSVAARQCLHASLADELEASMSMLINRNGKPYGAASAIDTAIQLFPDLIRTHDDLRTKMYTYANETIPRLLLSPSTTKLVHSLDLLQQFCDVRPGFAGCIKLLERAPQSSEKTAALRILLSSRAIASNPPLRSIAAATLVQALEGNNVSDWDVVAAAVSNADAPGDMTDDFLAKMAADLSIDDHRQSSLDGFGIVNKRASQTVKRYSISPLGAPLLERLLFLASGSDDNIAEQASALVQALEEKPLANEFGSEALTSRLNIIQRSFTEVTNESLPIISLCNQSKDILSQASDTEKSVTAVKLLPSQEQWSRALAPFLLRLPESSLALTTTFGGAIGLIKRDESSSPSVIRDQEGQSLAIRIARYVTELLDDSMTFDLIAKDLELVLTKNLSLVAQLASDDISVHGSMPLWDAPDNDSDVGLVDFVANAQNLLARWFQSSSNPNLKSELKQSLLDGSTGDSAVSYRHGRCFSTINAEDFELGDMSQNAYTHQLKAILKSDRPFIATALLTSVPGSKEITHLVNEILANTTGLDLENNREQILKLLVYLNAILQNHPTTVDEVPQQRSVFFVKHMVDILKFPDISIQTEILKALRPVLPRINTIYGTFWSEIFQSIQTALENANTSLELPLIGTSLCLLALLRKQVMQDGNDDLQDAWAEYRASTAKILIRLIGRLKDSPDRSDQPRRIINEILSRQAVDLRQDVADLAEELYPALASESEALQTAAYEILHANIPSKQEHSSLEKALDKGFEARLPEELLSLILASPSAAVSEATSLLPVRSYLLSWQLILDHWKNASYALQADYSKSLQEGTYLPDLLQLTFDVLITTRQKPVDASKFSIDSYEVNAESPQRDVEWLLIHAYYLLLLYLPSPTRSWWRDNTSRQTSSTVQNWTERYVSPLVISAELSAIKDWAAAQDSSVTASETPLSVKVSQTTYEISASLPVDEQLTTIGIRLPPSYPLARAEVSGIHRVGVAENRWQSWIRNAQGQLTVSDGGSNALIDCLLAWRRNVTAALKGQTGCAICYSVVGADKTLPKKECPTCKNRFHAGCLFRWFKSSNSSSCPLCRNTFAY